MKKGGGTTFRDQEKYLRGRRNKEFVGSRDKEIGTLVRK